MSYNQNRGWRGSISSGVSTGFGSGEGGNSHHEWVEGVQIVYIYAGISHIKGSYIETPFKISASITASFYLENGQNSKTKWETKENLNLLTLFKKLLENSWDVGCN